MEQIVFLRPFLQKKKKKNEHYIYLHRSVPILPIHTSHTVADTDHIFLHLLAEYSLSTTTYLSSHIRIFLLSYNVRIFLHNFIKSLEEANNRRKKLILYARGGGSSVLELIYVGQSSSNAG